MTKGKKLKKPTSKNTIHFKIREETPPVNYNLLKPSFSLKHMAYGGSYCISSCPNEEKSLIMDALLRLSQHTWREIRGLPKKSGFEKIPHHRFKVSLPRIFTPEVPILVARYNGNGGRLAGYRENDIYHIVLVGRDLYSH